MAKMVVRAGARWLAAGPKDLKREDLKNDQKSGKMKKIESTIKLCGI